MNSRRYSKFLVVIITSLVIFSLFSNLRLAAMGDTMRVLAASDDAQRNLESGALVGWLDNLCLAEGMDIGAYVASDPPTSTAVGGFEDLSGRHVCSVMWYQGWDASNQPPFPTSELNTGVRYHDGYNTHTILHLTWEPWAKLDDIAGGMYDSYLTSYASDAKNWGETIRLRFAHEMIQDGSPCWGQPDCQDWYPWQDQPTDYIAAFQHVHNVFTTAGATNVEFVWCPNNYPFDSSIVQQYYPGQGYVDWLCMDGYNPTNKDNKPGWPDWLWFDDIYYNIYHTFVEHQDIFGNKPVMIGEFASCEAGPYELSGQTKSAWITNAFERMKSPDYASIKAFYWFNINKECDWRINSSSQSLSSYQTAISDPYFSSHPISEPLYILFTSTGARDGWVLESTETSGKGGSMSASATTLRLGDNAAKKQYRSILSFATGSSLPDNAVITKVTLKIRKQSIVGGGNPITTFQGFMVDIKKGYFGTSALQTADFQTAGSKTYGPFKPALSSSWYSIDLTSGKNYINKLSTSSGLTQIRLRFKLDDNNNTTANYLSLYSGNAGSSYRPQLIIEYYVP
jgi:hypothetical protein